MADEIGRPEHDHRGQRQRGRPPLRLGRAREIVIALKRENITITADQVRLKGPLKELGLYTVNVHLGQEIEADLKVWVVPAVGEEPPKAEPRRMKD